MGDFLDEVRAKEEQELIEAKRRITDLLAQDPRTVTIEGRTVPAALVEAYADATYWPDEYPKLAFADRLGLDRSRFDLHNDIVMAAGFKPDDKPDPKFYESPPEVFAFDAALKAYVQRYRPKAGSFR